MLLTCIVVDDEPLAVRLMESYINKTPDLKLLGSFTDSVEAVNTIKEKSPNIIFLDIQMPDLNGMELAHMIPDETKVIFTTAFKEYAFESYEVKAIDFLLKPIRYNKFINAVEKAKEWFEIHGTQCLCNNHLQMHNTPPVTNGTIFIKVDGDYRQINIDKIIYVCGMKDYVMFYMENERKPLITYLRMKTVEEMLPTDKFMRVHRSYIVALDKIQKVDRNDCIYINEEIIHVTDAYRETFQSFLLGHQVNK